MQRVFITGGSGDLGRLIISTLKSKKISWVNYDLTPHPLHPENDVIGDICNPALLISSMKDCNMVIHIAALHGIHEVEGVPESKFIQVNVDGTKNVLLAMKTNKIEKLVFLSSESVNKKSSIYGRTKVACETMIDELCKQSRTRAVSLRCRSFIPHTNTSLYANFDEWLEYFAKGGVHISDVNQAVFHAMSYCERRKTINGTSDHIRIIIDGKYEVRKEVTDEEWEAYIDELLPLTVPHRLAFIKQKPRIKIDKSEYPNVIGYIPTYSIRDAIQESNSRIPHLIVTKK